MELCPSVCLGKVNSKTAGPRVMKFYRHVSGPTRLVIGEKNIEKVQTGGQGGVFSRSSDPRQLNRDVTLGYLDVILR